MFSLLNPLTKYLKIKNVRIYDGIFVLHSKVTVTLLFAFTCLISAKQYFGEPINCMAEEKNIEFVSSFCWTLGTYFLNHIDGKEDKDVIDFGVGPELPKVHERVYLRYYQWVVLILLLQAVAFFIPSFLWKVWEGGRLQQLCDDLGCVMVPDDWNKKKEMLISYFSYDYKEIHMCYALKYFLCEFLNFIICVINIFAMNVIFNGFWSNYAPALGAIPLYNWNEWNKHSSRVFPKIAKCEFKKFGHSGSSQIIDVLCLLPLNILNEKIFAFLWCWFLILTFVSGLNVLYRIFLICNKRFRLLLLRAQLRSMTSTQIRKAMGDFNIGDWFLLYKVCSNINPVLFRDLMKELLEIRRRRLNI